MNHWLAFDPRARRSGISLAYHWDRDDTGYGDLAPCSADWLSKEWTTMSDRVAPQTSSSPWVTAKTQVNLRLSDFQPRSMLDRPCTT